MTDMNPPTTAAQTAHTPTPWTFDEVPTSCGRAFRIGSREIIDGHEASKSRGALTLPAYAVIYDDYGSGETVNKANASYIVECCNNYSSALAQLRQAREWQTGTPDISKKPEKFERLPADGSSIKAFVRTFAANT